ncbi:nucleotidyl transferase AbiEii/AbiGii toxin family protein [candidate division WOR-3 bacterium]|nr:nucleotidyl transferase AbiEii/AbiGii toxin family protein [candidate division WOR-3 bacterium]
MLDIEQIEDFYPDNLKPFKRNILREYLQYKILEAIFDSEFCGKLSFMGGTALRVILSNKRFSEDLDFDNQGLSEKDFDDLTLIIKRRLELAGYTVETKNTFGNVYRSYLRIPEVLYNNRLSNHPEEKMMIQVDMEPQGFEYRSDSKILNKFDVFLRINIVPIDILLAQKITAIFTRPRPMGRDFYDVVFLLGRTSPNLDYLDAKLNIRNYPQLKEKLLSRCEELNFEQLARDVEPFLFDPRDAKRVILFKDYIKGL